MPTSPFYPQNGVYYTNLLFSLALHQDSKRTQITMRLFTFVVNTGYVPDTYRVLQEYLPTVLRAKCFNQGNLPFKEEVRKTEIGHLFEHVLIEYICQLKLLEGVHSVHNGVTEWNWQCDNKGVFHITVDAGNSEEDIFFSALEKSILLMNTILQSSRMDLFTGSSYQSSMA